MVLGYEEKARLSMDALSQCALRCVTQRRSFARFDVLRKMIGPLIGFKPSRV